MKAAPLGRVPPLYLVIFVGLVGAQPKEEEMVEKIEEMPAATIGFRAFGKLSPEDYREVKVYDLDQEDEATAWVAG